MGLWLAGARPRGMGVSEAGLRHLAASGHEPPGVTTPALGPVEAATTLVRATLEQEPARHQRLDSDPEEAEGRFQEDEAPELGGGQAGDRRDHVGQEVAEGDPHGASTERSRGLGELATHEREHRRADRTRVDDPGPDAEDRDQGRKTRTDQGQDRDGEQEIGEGELTSPI